MPDLTFFFLAEVNKVQTLVDQGLRITLDLPETEIAAAAKLMECKRAGVVIRVMVEVEAAEEPQAPQRVIERDPRARQN